MKDRVPLYPGRVKLIPVSGQENTYDMVRADEPTQEGDPLNKSTFLKDDTASIFGLGADAVPNDVLNVLTNSVLIKYDAVSLPYSAYWRSATYGNGKFVAVADGSDKVAYSADGVTWKSATLPSSAPWISVTYGDGKFVAVAGGSDKVTYSTDGITWSSATLPSSANWSSVTYGNGRFVAVVRSSSKAAYSADGITWVSVTLPSYNSWCSVTYGNGKFVAAAYGSTAAAYSSDGITWTSTTLPSWDTWCSVTYGNGKFVTVATGSSKAAYSADGITWASVTITSSDRWFYVTYGDGKFVAVADGSNKVAYSSDGVTWHDTAPALQNVSGDNISDDIGSVLGVTKIATGSYVGTCAVAYSGGESQDIILPFKPVIVFFASDYFWNSVGGLGAGWGYMTEASTYSGVKRFEANDAGMTVGTAWYSNSEAYPALNTSGKTYKYIAIG